MSEDLTFDLDFPARPGSCEDLTPLLRRLVADNPSPFTFRGTCSYIVGRGRVAIVDPGPDLPAHLDNLLDAVRGETVEAIVVTHTHRDHSPLARALAAKTGAPIVGAGPHRASRALGIGEAPRAEAGGDLDHRPDRILADGEGLEGEGWRLEAIATPGHTANHLAFALPQEKALLSGDHVMGWSTTIVAPPDGSMRDYMASLDKLRSREETIYWPGHGGPVKEPQRYLRALAHHRRQREASIMNRLAAGDRAIPAIVAELYRGIRPALVPAAGLSVFAHLEDLVGRGLVATDGDPRLDGSYRPA